MAEFNFQFDNNGRIPCDITKTVGTLEVLKVLEPKQGFEDGQPTGEITERPVECLSEVTEGSVLISFAPEVDVVGLKPFDAIELVDDSVDIVAWANIDANSFSNYAEGDVKIKATKFKKIGGGTAAKTKGEAKEAAK